MFLYKGDTEEVRAPMELGYMRRIKCRLSFLDSWPLRARGERALPLRDHRLLFVLWTSTLVLQIKYIRDNKSRVSFFELGHSYITALMTTVDCHRITLIWTKGYREVAEEFVNDIHLFHHRHASEYSMKTYRLVNKICTIFTIYLHVQMIAGVILFNGAPLVNNISSGMFSASRPGNGTFVHCVYYSLPFDYTHRTLGYLAVAIGNMVLTYDAGSCFCVFDNYLSLIVFHVWGHLRVLDHHLATFPRPGHLPPAPPAPGPARDQYTEDEAREVAVLLKRNIDHHRKIMTFVRKTSAAFGPMLAVYFTFHQVCGCILLLECSKLDVAALMEYGVLTMIMFQQLVQISFVFEILGSQSETLKEAVYGLPWECMAPRERRLVLFYLSNVQEPISLKAMGLVSVGVQTMAGILKTSVTYFMLLQTVAQ